jgi:hypothetical protein
MLPSRQFVPSAAGVEDEPGNDVEYRIDFTGALDAMRRGLMRMLPVQVGAPKTDLPRLC